MVRQAGWTLSSTSTLTCSRLVGDPQRPGVRVSVRDRSPRAGESCADVDFERVAFVVSGDHAIASFALFGGGSQGAIHLAPDQVAMIDTHVAYVADVQLGTYEEVTGNGHLVCSLTSTYHFDCPTSQQLDRLCLVWFRRSLVETDG